MVTWMFIDIVISASIILGALRVAYWIIKGLKEDKPY